MTVDQIELLAPQKVPSESAMAAWPRRSELNHALTSRGAGQPTHSDQMSSALDHLVGLMSGECGETVVDGLDDDIAHDAYFHVTRIIGDPPPLFIRTVLVARQILLREASDSPVTMSGPLLGEIDHALADLLHCLLGGETDVAPVVTVWDAPSDRQEPMPRWIRGHQIFAALTQGLIFSFQALGRAVRAGNTVDIRRWSDLTIRLLRGSGASFVLTGDFSVEDYIRDIRPSMMPPIAPICLSGLMSVDHRVLVQSMRDLRPALRSLHEREKDRHEQIHAELKTVYDRHIHVCERFVGERPSLLTAGSTEKSGPALIEQFKTLRLKAFDSVQHATRLGRSVVGH